MATPRDHDPRQRMVFAPGAIARLGELTRELGARRVLLVTDPGLVQAGHAGKGRAALEAAGIEVALFDGTRENPTIEHVAAGVAAARAAGVDSIVALGGGSSMDCAKGINFILTSGGEMRDYQGIGKAKGPMLPMIAVPTTAGTGSEMQSFALITDPVTRQKMACGDARALARVALLDPELTVTQPAAVTAATGIDAISHAVESLVTRRRSPASQGLSIEAWRLLDANFERVLDLPQDLDARGGMLMGAALAGAAIEASMLGATHSAANPLTSRFGVIHGHAIGILLPHVVRFNGAAAGEEYRRIAPSAEALARRIEALHAASRLPRRLADFGVAEDDLPGLAAEAAQQWTAQFNPRPVAADDFVEIYRCAL